MACRLYNTERCLQHQLFNRPNFGVHFISVTCHGSFNDYAKEAYNNDAQIQYN